MKKQTHKKIKYVGTQSYINADTGEVVEMYVTEVEDRDFNFGKIWLKNFISTIDLVGNQKTKLCFWIIDNLNKENEIAKTYRQIADETGMSYQTVSMTMKILQDVDFLKKVGTAYRVNPDIYFKGTHIARMKILNDYRTASTNQQTPIEKKLENLEESIAKLYEKKKKLEKELRIEKLWEESLKRDEEEERERKQKNEKNENN